MVIAVISVGGMLGAEARYGLGVALPHGRGQFPFATLGINTTGCLLLGVLMVFVERGNTHRLLRPFLGVGVIGGYTTFSSFAVDVGNLVDTRHPALALLYWVLTLLAGWAAVLAGFALARRSFPPSGSRT